MSKIQDPFAVDYETGKSYDVSNPSQPVEVNSDIPLWLNPINWWQQRMAQSQNAELQRQSELADIEAARQRASGMQRFGENLQQLPGIIGQVVQGIPSYVQNLYKDVPLWQQALGPVVPAAKIGLDIGAKLPEIASATPWVGAQNVRPLSQPQTEWEKAGQLMTLPFTSPFTGQPATIGRDVASWLTPDVLIGAGLPTKVVKLSKAAEIGAEFVRNALKRGEKVEDIVRKLSYIPGLTTDDIAKILPKTEPVIKQVSELAAKETLAISVRNLPAEVPPGIPPTTPLEQLGFPPPGKGGVPPKPPPAGNIPGATIPPSGRIIPNEMGRIITQSVEQVKQDTPGTLTKLFQRVPGLKQVMEYERPGLKVADTENVKLLIGQVAENAAKSDVSLKALATRQPIINNLRTIFGDDVLHGGKSTVVSFKGTVEQAAHPLTGTLKDMADNPELYNLTTKEKMALTELNTRNNKLLDHVTEGYGAEIGTYPAKDGGAYLPNVDISEDVIEYLRSESRAAVSGRGKTRIWPSARERMTHDATFKPELDVQKLIEGLDSFKASAAGGQTFREVVGGLTRLEVIEKTHPELYKEMMTLRGRLASFQGSARTIDVNLHKAVKDFLTSPTEITDLNSLQDALDIRLKTGKRAGLDADVIQKEMDGIREQIKTLKPGWDIANPKPYHLVQEGIYRYFPTDQAKYITESRKVSNNPFTNFIEKWRGQAFSGDVSPFAVQGSIGVLADPIGSLKALKGAIDKPGGLGRTVSIDALAEDIAKNTDRWSSFASLAGRSLHGTPQEFAAGFLSKVPGFDKFTEATYATVTRGSFDLWERQSKMLVKAGMSQLEADVAAYKVVSEIFPILNPTRLGQSAARASFLRALPTSYSFIRQPATMMTDATKGFLKLALRKPLTPSEQLSTKLMATMAASVLTISATSAAVSAQKTGKDVQKEIIAAINPDPKNGKFASLVFGDFRVPLGGPYRALFRAIFPNQVKGSPLPIPFAGLVNYAWNRLTPALKTQKDLLINKDYYGNEIRKGNFVEQILRSLAYEVEGALPLSGAAVVEGIRTGAPPEEILQQAVGQFAGANVIELTPAQKKLDLQDKIARDNGYKNWTDRELDDFTRNQLIANNPSLQEAIDKTNIESGKRAQGDAKIWNTYKTELQRAADTRQKDLDLAIKKFRATKNGNQFREDYTALEKQYYKIKTFIETNPEYKIVQDYYATPLTESQIQNENPKDLARRDYYNMVYAPGIYNQYGEFDYDVFEQRKQQFVNKYGQPIVNYVESFYDKKRETEPDEVKLLRRAREILKPYWEVEDYLWSKQDPRLKQISDGIKELEAANNPKAEVILKMYPQILFMRKQIALIHKQMRKTNPLINGAYQMFYGR